MFYSFLGPKYVKIFKNVHPLFFYYKTPKGHVRNFQARIFFEVTYNSTNASKVKRALINGTSMVFWTFWLPVCWEFQIFFRRWRRHALAVFSNAHNFRVWCEKWPKSCTQMRTNVHKCACVLSPLWGHPKIIATFFVAGEMVQSPCFSRTEQRKGCTEDVLWQGT